MLLDEKLKYIDPESCKFSDVEIDDLPELDPDFLTEIVGEYDEGVTILGIAAISVSDLENIPFPGGIFERVNLARTLLEIQESLQGSIEYMMENGNYSHEYIVDAKKELAFFISIKEKIKSAVRVNLAGRSTEEMMEEVEFSCSGLKDHFKVLFNLTLPIAVVPEGPDGAYIENQIILHSYLKK